MELAMPYLVGIEFHGKGTLIMAEARTVKQLFPVADKVTLSADKVIHADVTFDLPYDKAVTCHHEAIDLRANPFLPEDIGNNTRHLRGHCREAARV